MPPEFWDLKTVPPTVGLDLLLKPINLTKIHQSFALLGCRMPRKKMSLVVALMKSHFTSAWKSDRQREKSGEVRVTRERWKRNSPEMEPGLPVSWSSTRLLPCS